MLLPEGYRARPVTTDDIPAVRALLAAGERRLYGRVESDTDSVAADLARPGLDLALDTLLVHGPAGDPAAWAWVNRRSEVRVHPDHRGLRLGAALLRWTEERAAATGTERLVQIVPDQDAEGVALLRSRGFEPVATNWLLAIDLPTEPEVPEPPTGITVRPYRSGDGPAAHQLLEDAFDEWQQRRKSYREWAILTVDRQTFAPDRSPLAFHGDELIGVVLALDDPGLGEGYIERVAVRRDHRNRGIARLLLRHAFRAVHRAGQRSCTLWTHSQTGALALYERVGMTVRRSSTVFGKDIDAPTGSGRGAARYRAESGI